MTLPLLDGHPLVAMDEEATRERIVELLRDWLSRHALVRPGRVGWLELVPQDGTGVQIARALVALGEPTGMPDPAVPAAPCS